MSILHAILGHSWVSSGHLIKKIKRADIQNKQSLSEGWQLFHGCFCVDDAEGSSTKRSGAKQKTEWKQQMIERGRCSVSLQPKILCLWLTLLLCFVNYSRLEFFIHYSVWHLHYGFLLKWSCENGHECYHSMYLSYWKSGFSSRCFFKVGRHCIFKVSK